VSGPRLCVGAIAVDADRLLMIRRGRAPGAGEWSVPGGHVEPGELLAEAVVRELLEETGIEGVCGELVGWEEFTADGLDYVILDFAVEVLAPAEPVAGDDATEARWVPLADVAELALVDGMAEFLHEHGVIPTIT
jgi:8-oxo-dGTP diphosphatase